jgi:methylamine---glutamate N-methyltransferase subunit B
MNAAQVLVPEIRDYQKINLEVARLLDSGAHLIRLVGVERQRLLLAGLRGGWDADIVVDGPAGPELAAGLNAAGLTILASDDVDDGAGSRMVDGRLLILGDADDGLAARIEGGLVVVLGRAGNRAALRQQGGRVVVRGGLGRLAGDRHSGGELIAPLVKGYRSAFGPRNPASASYPSPWTSPSEMLTIDDCQAFTRILQRAGRAWPLEAGTLPG